MVLDLPEPTLRIDKLGARVRKIHARSQTNLQSVHLKSMSQYMHNMDIWILVLLHWFILRSHSFSSPSLALQPGMSGSVDPGMSNRWSCATLQDGLDHVKASLSCDGEMPDEEEAKLLAELEDHTNLLFENDVAMFAIYLFFVCC